MLASVGKDRVSVSVGARRETRAVGSRCSVGSTGGVYNREGRL